MRQYIGLATLLIAGLGQSAHAGVITLAAQSAAGASSAPFTLLSVPNPSGQTSVDFGNGVTAVFSPDASTPMAGVYSGSQPNVATSPFSGTKLSGSNYLVAQPNDPVTITYSTPQTMFDLLWGTVDTYNALSITFCNGSICSASSSITGSQVAAAAGISANGSTPAFVELSNTSPFNSITLSSSGIAFEFVPAVPEPVTLSILGTGLVGLGMAKRRRKQPSAR